MKSAITVSLIGGLGNQLFCYYAAAALARTRETGLIVDATWAAHGVSIGAFDLEGHWINPRPRPLRPVWGRASLGYRALMKTARNSKVLRRQLRLYDSSGVGHDDVLLSQPAGTRIRGYFQSWRLVADAVARGAPRRPTLRQESSWLVAMRDEAEETQPIMVHVRRGDYVSHDFGLVGEPYYVSAIERLRASGLSGPIWIFSDEPDKVPGGLLDAARMVASPAGAYEDLVLMSHGAGNVIANSTFSWWGAWMNPRDVPVVYPEPWFKTPAANADLVPPWWIAETSSWETP